MILIIPDIHTEIATYNYLMNKYKDIKIKISLGDWYDSFIFQSGVEAGEMARLQADFVSNPDNICLFGNHDMQYAFPNCPALGCSGWSSWKQKPIDRWMKGLWSKVKLCHWVYAADKTWLISHAGIHPYFSHPINGLNELETTLLSQKTICSIIDDNEITEFVSVGRRRRGNHLCGGCTWMDWQDFKPIVGINQIVGHTRGNFIREYRIDGSENYCIDTGLNHVALLDDIGKITIEKI